MKKILWWPFFLLSLLIQAGSTGCGSNTNEYDIPINTDSASINKGQLLFNQYCSNCHNFRQDGIGPHLAGITDSAKVSWIIEFIRSPKAMIDDGDLRARAIHTKYKTVMPDFRSFTDEEMESLVAFMHSQKKESSPQKHIDPGAIDDPLPDSIAYSGIEIDMEIVGQIPASASKPPLARIVKMDVQPGTGKTFILDLRGKLYQLKDSGTELYFDIARLKPKFIHQPGLATGFGSFAFHPEFATNGLFYTTHTEPPNSGIADFFYDDSIKVTLQWVISEWKTLKPIADSFNGTGRELFRINMLTQLHGVQDIEFNPYAKDGEDDYGQLYIAVGDGGSVENGHPELVHRRDRVWGTILRINPTGKNGRQNRYGIASSNPFAGNKDGSLKEVFAYGFRNPNRLTWTHNGRLLATNIGHAQLESIYHVVKGGNHGWPYREGTFALHPDNNLTHVYPLPTIKRDIEYERQPVEYIFPVAQYDHDEGKAIAGGYEYTGSALPILKDKYLFGDIVNGRLFFIDVTNLQQGKPAEVKEWKVRVDGKSITLRALSGNIRVDLRFGRDARGEMYVFTKADGKVYKLVPARLTNSSTH